MNSRRKGAGGELDAAHWLTDETGVSWIRAAQRCGRNGQADVVPEVGWPDGVPRLHVEVKRVAKLAVRHFLDQAILDAGDDADSGVPLVLMREDRGPGWMALLRGADFLRLSGWKAVDR